MKNAFLSILRCSIVGLMVCVVLFAFDSCRPKDFFVPSEEEQKGDSLRIDYMGFYLLNEGNMGSNKATLDFYDFSRATYTRNIYSEVNPNMPQSLGDVGNDIKVYGNRLYAVINCSNFVEVMDLYTAKHIGTVEVPNCRYLRFHDGYGYLTSYAGPVVIDSTKAQIGYVAKFDTATLQVVDTCHVGFQPDELEVVGGKLYVANSGGYMVPNYENTVSVIDLATFKCINTIVVARNLHHLRADHHGMLWVTSRGDYFDQPSRLYCVDTNTDQLLDSVIVAVSNLWLDGDSLYIYGTEWSYGTMSTSINYGIVDVVKHELVNDHLIQDAGVQIKVPYGIMVNPVTKDIYITDAKNYVSPGTLWCLGQDGIAKWNVRTGDIPAHMCLVPKPKQTKLVPIVRD